MATRRNRPNRRSRRSSSSRIGEPPEVEIFADFCETLKTVNGPRMRLEDWQRAVVADIFGGARETLVLVPKGNGKTTLFAALALFHLLSTQNADAFIAASSRQQARLMYDHARGFVRRSEGLEELLDVKAGYGVIRNRADMGTVQVLAADADTADGVGPTMAFVDELHRHKSSHLYTVFRDGLPKRNGQLVTISTAGIELDSTLGLMRSNALDMPDVSVEGSHTRAASRRFVMHEWSVPQGADTDDLEVVQEANPSSFVTVESLEDRRLSASMREIDWLRFACNQWVESEDPWLPTGAWDACFDEAAQIPEGAEVVLGVDIGTRKDTSAVVRSWLRDDDRIVVEAEVWKARGEEALDISEVVERIAENAERYEVRAVAYDKWAFAYAAEQLEDRGLFMVNVPQSNERMTTISMSLYERINDRTIAHDGDHVLASHVRAGATKDHERGWRLVKGKAAKPIDALIAMALSVSELDAQTGDRGKAFEVLA